MDLIKEVLTALRIPMIEMPGYEADDVIGTLATQAEQAGFDVFVVSGDRDAFQLISDRVTVLYPRKGVSDLARMDPARDPGALRPARLRSTRSWRPWWGRTPTTSRASPGWVRRRRRSGWPSSVTSMV